MAAKQTPEKEAPAPRDNLDLLDDLPVLMTMEVGRTRMILDEVADLGEQSLVEMDRKVGDPVDVFLNGRLFARGEVVTVSENFGVRVIEIVGQV